MTKCHPEFDLGETPNAPGNNRASDLYPREYWLACRLGRRDLYAGGVTIWSGYPAYDDTLRGDWA